MKAFFSWSSGKDAALALHQLQTENQIEVSQLITTVNRHYERVSMHGLRNVLLEQQAAAIGIPLTMIELPEEPSMEVYDEIMNKQLARMKEEGFKKCVFGDIFLEDLRSYRENQLKAFGISAHFPLWKRDTKTLIKTFIDLGFKAITVCVKSELLDESFVGREINEQFVRDIPDQVDPCGENGEFHTFCYDGPIFQQAIPFEVGEKVFRSYRSPKKEEEQTNEKSMGFWFVDLLPKTS